MDIDLARQSLLPRATLMRDGLTDRMLAASVEKDQLYRLDYGVYVEAGTWSASTPEMRHLLRVLAAAHRMRGTSDVFSHVSAAVVHGLPLFRLDPQNVHLSGLANDGATGSGRLAVSRHRVGVAQGDVEIVDGVAVTSLARTVADVLRTVTREAGLVVADAALGRVAQLRRNGYDDARAAEFVARVARHLPRGGRGVRRAREVLELADGRAGSPGESVSRLYLHDLGFARPRLQVPIAAPRAGWYYADFGLDDVGLWGEYDGEIKYRDPTMRDGRSLEDVLRAEKAREDWIRGTTGRRVIRWSSADIRSAHAFSVLLSRFHVRPLARLASRQRIQSLHDC